MKVYVGEWSDRPNGIKRDTCFDYTHPKHFADLLEKIRLQNPDYEFWTNNPYILDAFSPSEVFFCKNGVVKCVTEHPHWEKYKDTFECAVGEFWSLTSDDWVSNVP